MPNFFFQRFYKRTSTFLGCTLLLQGCIIPPNFCPPSIAGEVTALPGEQWDPSFDEWYCKREPAPIPEGLSLGEDQDLSGLLDIALTNHPLTKAAWRRARAAAYAVGAAKSTYYPNISFMDTLELDHSQGGGVSSAGGNVITGAGSLLPRYTQVNVEDLLVSYLVLDFGGREASVRSTMHALQALNWSQNRIVQQVIISVIQGYYTYIGAKELSVAKKADLENAELDLEAAQVLFETGIAREVDYLQALASRENAKLNLVSAINQVKITLGQLAVALGMPPSEDFGVKGIPEYFPVDEVSENIDELMEMAKLNRPDLASAYATWLQKKNDYQATISSSLPTINAFADLQRTQFFHHTGIDGHNYLGQVVLNVPLFSGFLYENQIRQARENIAEAKANFENLESLVLLDVLSGYYNFVSAKESLQYSEKFLQYSEEAYQAALLNYQSGTGSLVDLLASHATLSNARSQRINSRTNWAFSLFNIAYATGTLDLAKVSERLGRGGAPCK